MKLFQTVLVVILFSLFAIGCGSSGSDTGQSSVTGTWKLLATP